MRSFDLAIEPLTGCAACIVVAATTLLFSCAPPRYVPATPPLSDPTAVLEEVRRREDEIRSLRARFKATASYESDASDVTGVLLVRKTDRFRMRLMLPLGITVLDYVSHGDDTWTFLPLSKGEGTEGATLFSPADVREMFQRGAAAFPGTCTAGSDSPSIVDVVCRSCDECPVLRSMRLDRRSGTIAEETSYDNGEPHFSVRYEEYREVSGLPLPFHLVMTYPLRRLKVEIQIRAYEVNPELSDELFTPPRGAKAERLKTTLYPGDLPAA